MQAGLSAWLCQLNMLFAKCFLCALHVIMPGGHGQGPGLPREGLLGTTWRLQGPAGPVSTHTGWPSSQQSTEKGHNHNPMAGSYLPAGQDTAATPQQARSPRSGSRACVATAFLPDQRWRWRRPRGAAPGSAEARSWRGLQSLYISKYPTNTLLDFGGFKVFSINPE